MSIQIAGRIMTSTIADVEGRCKALIAIEQEKPLPDNLLIDTLCECVRMGREYTDYAERKLIK